LTAESQGLTGPEVTSFPFGGDPLPGSAENNATNPSANGISSFAAASLDSTGNVDAATPPPTIVTASAASEAQVSTDTAPPITVADGATAEIHGVSNQSVSFEGTSGELKLDDARAFTGQVSGLAGSDVLDPADVSFGPNTTAIFLGDATGGTLTVTDGTHTANISLVGNYLSSNWDLSSGGSGG